MHATPFIYLPAAARAWQAEGEGGIRERDDSPDAAPAIPRAAMLSKPWAQVPQHMLPMAISPWYAALALSLTVRLVIASKSTTT